jgi:hypothetical protein
LIECHAWQECCYALTRASVAAAIPEVSFSAIAGETSRAAGWWGQVRARAIDGILNAVTDGCIGRAHVDVCNAATA